MIRLCCFIDFAQPKEGKKEGKEEERAAIQTFLSNGKQKKNDQGLCSSTFRPPPFSPNNTKAYKHKFTQPWKRHRNCFLGSFFFKKRLSSPLWLFLCQNGNATHDAPCAADSIQKMTSYSKESADCYDRYLSGEPFNRVFNASIV